MKRHRKRDNNSPIIIGDTSQLKQHGARQLTVHTVHVMARAFLPGNVVHDTGFVVTSIQVGTTVVFPVSGNAMPQNWQLLLDSGIGFQVNGNESLVLITHKYRFSTAITNGLVDLQFENVQMKTVNLIDFTPGHPPIMRIYPLPGQKASAGDFIQINYVNANGSSPVE